MHVNYSFRRIALLLRAGWMEHKKSYLSAMGLLFLAWILLLSFSFAGGNSMNPKGGFWHLGMFVSWLLFCRHAGRRIHRPRGIYFLLPASNEEKYTALLAEGLAWLAGFQVVFWSALWICKPFAPGFAIPSWPQVVYNSGNEGLNGSEAGIFLVSALWLLSYMSFRKYALHIVTAGIAAYLLLFILAVWSVFDGAEILKDHFEPSYLDDTVVFLSAWFPQAMIFSALVVMYVAYLKLKEKEKR